MRHQKACNSINDNGFDVIEVLEKIAIIPMHYTITIDKNIDGTICSEDDINLKYFLQCILLH